MKKPTILIADDEPHMRSALRRRLTLLGYNVAESPDGLGVLAQCPKGGIDVLILDHGMPNGDGRAIARVIRNETDVPIVFISGHDREAFRSIVSELRDVYFLPKPLDDDRLRELLGALLPLPPKEPAEATP